MKLVSDFWLQDNCTIFIAHFTRPPGFLITYKTPPPDGLKSSKKIKASSSGQRHKGHRKKLESYKTI